MATKQRRPVPKSPKRPRPSSPAQAGRPARALSPPAQPAPQPPQRRTTYVEAVVLYERALEIQEMVLGPEHPEVANSLNNLAELYRAQGKYDARPAQGHVRL